MCLFFVLFVLQRWQKYELCNLGLEKEMVVNFIKIQ